MNFFKQNKWVTIVTGTSHILDHKRPRPSGVLIPGVGGHERPVVETLWRVIMRPAAERPPGTFHLFIFFVRVCLLMCPVFLCPSVRTWGGEEWSACRQD